MLYAHTHLCACAQTHTQHGHIIINTCAVLHLHTHGYSASFNDIICLDHNQPVSQVPLTLHFANLHTQIDDSHN